VMTGPSEKHAIRLEGIQVNAPVGYYSHERENGVAFLVNMEVGTDFSRAGLGDEIADTINYEDLVAVVKKEMSKPAKLIEYAACRIKEELLRLFPAISYLRLELQKQAPPLALKTASATIVITYNR